MLVCRKLAYLPAVSQVEVGSEDDGQPHAYIYDYNGAVVEGSCHGTSIYGGLYNLQAVKHGICVLLDGPCQACPLVAYDLQHSQSKSQAQAGWNG